MGARAISCSTKLFVFLSRRPDLSPGEFSAHWRNQHAPLALRMQPVRRYVQSHGLSASAPGFPEAPHDGIAESWFDDLATAVEMGRDPDYLSGAKLDEPNFVDGDRMAFLLTDADVVVGDGSSDDSEVKLFHLVRRRADVTPEQFGESWARRGDEGIAGALGATRHAVCRAAPVSYHRRDPIYDGVRELWWPDVDAWRAATQTPEWTRLGESEVIDLVASPMMLAEQHTFR